MWPSAPIGCVFAGVFSRVVSQLAVGAAVAVIGGIGLEAALEGDAFQGQGGFILPAVTALMSAVGVLAAIGAARRGLRIQPTEALREE